MSGTRVLSPPLPALDGPVDFVHPNSPISIIATPLDAGECILCVPVGSAIVCHISANSAANISTGNYRHSTGIDDFRKVLIRRLKKLQVGKECECISWTHFAKGDRVKQLFGEQGKRGGGVKWSAIEWERGEDK